jgi:hypothetical protein
MRRSTVLLCAILPVLSAGVASAQTQGPSSSATPYVLPVAPGVVTKSILTVGDSVNLKPDGVTPYRMVGIPDGTGAYDNGDGTFTFLVNHELGATSGIARAHGTAGAFVSKWTINKSTLAVSNGSDLIQTVAGVSGGTAPFGRFCSADLPLQSAFQFGALGTSERIFMNGEEVGAEGRAFGTIVSTGEAHYLPQLGKFSWENSVASPFAQAKTVVVGLDDSTPGQVYVYVGNKTNTGTAIDKAGLNGGKLYGVKTPSALETIPGVAGSQGAATGAFTMVDASSVVTPSSGTSGASLQTFSRTNGITEFARPEDGAWDTNQPNDFYFVTTGANTDTTPANTSPEVPNRLYRMRFADITQPELGGQLQLVLDGTNSASSASLPYRMDNLTLVDGKDGKTRILIQEDPGGNARLARIWQYTVEDGSLLEVATHDSSRFISGAPNFITQDEEASGIIPAWDLLGEGWYLQSDQIHAGVTGELVEQGQLSAIYIPQSIPEPTALAMVGLAATAMLRRRK